MEAMASTLAFMSCYLPISTVFQEKSASWEAYQCHQQMCELRGDSSCV